MKTTLYLPDPLYKRLKIAAVSAGTTLTDMIERCLTAGLAAGTKPRSEKKYQLPLLVSKKPGSRRVTQQIINEALADSPRRRR